MAAAGERAVIRERLRKAHRDPRSDRCGQAHQECIGADFCGKRRGEQRRERGDRPVHEARQTGLDNLEHEKAPGRPLLRGPRLRGEMFARQ